ncbi:hypothetical protein CLU79DRAFT_823969, partial [Phycomyces nitens]
MNVNELTSAQITELLELARKLKVQENSRDRLATYELPQEILDDMETTSRKGLKGNLQRFAKDALTYEGGSWTKGGAINKDFIPELKRSHVDTLTVVQGRYKEADKLRTTASIATEIFDDLKAFIAGDQSKDMPKKSSKRHAAWPSMAMLQQSMPTKTQKTLSYVLSTSLPKSGTLMMMKTKETESWSSLPTWSSRSTNTIMRNLSSKLLLPLDQATRMDITEETMENVARGFTGEEVSQTVGNQLLQLRPGVDISKITPPAQATAKDSPSNSLTSHNQTSNCPSPSGPLYRTSRWDPTRRPARLFCRSMEELDKSPMAKDGHRGGIPCPMDEDTTPMEKQTVSTVRGRPKGSRYCSQQVLAGRRRRKFTKPKRRLLVKHVHRSRNRQEAPHTRLQINQSIYSMRTLQDGGCSRIERYDNAKRFDYKDRFKGCLCGSTDSQGISPISFVSTSWQGIPIPFITIWSQCSTESLFQAHAIRIRASAAERDPPGLLPGRRLLAGER